MNQGSNNNSGGFLQRFQGWISIGTGVFGFLTALVGFIKLALGDTGLITNVLLVFGIVSLWLLCAYIYWKPSSVSRSVGLAVKSLLRFGHEVEYLKYNAAIKIKAPKPKQTLAERILSELEVMTIIYIGT